MTGRSASGVDSTAGLGTVRLVSDGGTPRFTTRRTDRGLLVTADLRGVVRNDHRTELDLVENALILTVGKRFVWRVELEADRPTIADVSLNNDVLQARIDAVE